MSYRQRFDQKYQALVTREDLEVEEYEPGPPVSAETVKRAEESLGRPLPTSVLALYKSLNGVRFRWRHREFTHISGQIALVPLEVMFGGINWRDQDVWDDSVHEGTIWQPHFEEEGPETFAIFKSLKLLELVEGVSMEVCLRFLPKKEEPEIWVADRWTPYQLDLTLPKYLDWALETGGIPYWFQCFTPGARGMEDINKAFNQVFPTSRFLEPGYKDRPRCIKPLPREGARKPQNAGEQLFAALKAGDEKALVAALDAGADLNAPSPAGNTPLHEAERLGHHRLAALLVVRGASLEVRHEKTSQTPFQYQGPPALEPLHQALLRAAESASDEGQARLARAFQLVPPGDKFHPAVETFLRSCLRGSEGLRQASASALRHLARAESGPALLEVLESGAHEDALWGSLKVRSDKLADAIARLLEKLEPRLRPLAVLALWATSSTPARAEPHFAVLQEVMERPAKAGEDPLKDAAVPLLIARPPKEKANLEVIYRMLLRILEHDSLHFSPGDVREAGIELLGTLAPRGQLEAELARLLRKHDFSFQKEAIQLLVQQWPASRERAVELKDVLLHWVKYLHSPSTSLQASELLWLMGEREAVLGFYLAFLPASGGFWDVSQAILKKLPRLGKDAERLRQALTVASKKDPIDSTRQLAAKALARLGKASTVKASPTTRTNQTKTTKAKTTRAKTPQARPKPAKPSPRKTAGKTRPKAKARGARKSP